MDIWPKDMKKQTINRKPKDNKVNKREACQVEMLRKKAAKKQVRTKHPCRKHKCSRQKIPATFVALECKYITMNFMIIH